jgi:hypothetical protein
MLITTIATVRSPLAVLLLSTLALIFPDMALGQTAANPTAAPAQPTPKAAPVTFSKGVRAADARAPTPQFTAIAAGLYARPIVDTQSAKGDYAIRVWSLAVAPKVTTAATTLPGAAVLSLTAGSVEFSAGDRRGKLQPGDTAAIPEGVALTLTNTDPARPAALRAVIVSGR